MCERFSEKAREVLLQAKKEMKDLKHSYISSEHLFLALLKLDEEIALKFKEENIDYKMFKKEIIKNVGFGKCENPLFLYTPLLKRIIENAIIDSKENNNGVVETIHLFVSLLEEGEGVAIRILSSLDVDIDALYSSYSYKTSSIKNNNLLLEEYGVNLNEKAKKGEIEPAIGREKEIKRIIEILSRKNKNNPLLIGLTGVGKTAIVEEISNLIVKGDVPLFLKNKKIINVDMSSLVAGTKYRGEFEERINKILNETEKNQEIILFIDEIHTLVGAGGAEGAIDASNIFKPALARGKLKCIGATTIDEYKKFIEPDGALERRFQKVLIEPPNENELKNILIKLKPIYENYHNVIVNDLIIDLIVTLSSKYIYDRNEPDRSIDVLDEVCAMVSLKESKKLKEYKIKKEELNCLLKEKKEALIRNDFSKASSLKKQEFILMDKINKLELFLYKKNLKKVTKKDVAEVINSKTGVPLYEILNVNKNDIKGANKIFKGIIGQNKQIEEILKYIKKIKLGLNKNHSFLFCGPSGVGKTEVAKIFGNYLVSPLNVIKVDMSEYKEPHSVSKIIGSPPGYVGFSDSKTLLDDIKIKPYSVLILDEIEKAHSDVINLFLQILEDKKIKDSKGNVIRFDNVTIIMTSNSGFNKQNLGFNSNRTIKDHFSIPFINRIDSVIQFDYLKKEDIKEIVNNEIKKIKEKYQIQIKISQLAIEEIILSSNYEEFGARRVLKLVKDKIENEIVNAIIDGKDTVFIKESVILSN